MIKPYYTKLSAETLSGLEKLVRQHGYKAVVAGIADILTQDPHPLKKGEPQLSFALGQCAHAAEYVDSVGP